MLDVLIRKAESFFGMNDIPVIFLVVGLTQLLFLS
jgi:hypothetical protein